jgi:putative transposase
MPVYGLELRQRVIDASLLGGTNCDVAARFSVSLFFVKSMKKLHRESGNVERRPSRAGRPRKLADREAEIRELIEAQPDLTLAQLRAALNTDAAISTIADELARLKLTFKKNRSTPQSKTGLT